MTNTGRIMQGVSRIAVCLSRLGKRLLFHFRKIRQGLQTKKESSDSSLLVKTTKEYKIRCAKRLCILERALKKSMIEFVSSRFANLVFPPVSVSTPPNDVFNLQ